jgi:hypothetical protein
VFGNILLLPLLLPPMPAGEEVARLQLSQLQSELQALQQELVRSGAAAMAAGSTSRGPAAAAAGPLSLGDALRELGQWQLRAQEAEARLDEVGCWDGCGVGGRQTEASLSFW